MTGKEGWVQKPKWSYAMYERFLYNSTNLSFVIVGRGHGLGGAEGRGADSPGQLTGARQLAARTQVRHLHAVFAQQKVCWLDVSVRYPLVMH